MKDKKRHINLTQVPNTSHHVLGGSHSRLLEIAIINIQALGDQTNPPVLWLKSDVISIKAVPSQFNFIVFFIVKNDHSTFFNGRIRFLFRSATESHW